MAVQAVESILERAQVRSEPVYHQNTIVNTVIYAYTHLWQPYFARIHSRNRGACKRTACVRPTGVAGNFNKLDIPAFRKIFFEQLAYGGIG